MSPLFDFGVLSPRGLVPGFGRRLVAVRIGRAPAGENCLSAGSPHRGGVDRVGRDLQRVFVTLLLHPHGVGGEILKRL